METFNTWVGKSFKQSAGASVTVSIKTEYVTYSSKSLKGFSNADS